MTKVSCPTCGVTMLDCRRYRLSPLAEFMRCTVPTACRMFGISGTSEIRARCHGITRQVVDRIAADLKAHPSAIWPEVIDHDIEDSQARCEECGTPFFPVRRSHRFCSSRCSTRRRQRELYRTDPDYRERRRAERKRTYDATRDYERARERRRYHTTGVSERRRARYATDAAYRAQRIAESAAYRERRRARDQEAA